MYINFGYSCLCRNKKFNLSKIRIVLVLIIYQVKIIYIYSIQYPLLMKF